MPGARAADRGPRAEHDASLPSRAAWARDREQTLTTSTPSLLRYAIAVIGALALSLGATVGLDGVLAPAGLVTADGGQSVTTLDGISFQQPTSLDFGPDGRLYVAEQGGAIAALTVAHDDSGFRVLATERVDLLLDLPNHDDTGRPAPEVTGRLVTGILAVGTAAEPEVYVVSADPRLGGPANGDLDVDTNSGVLSRLSRRDGSWLRQDLVRGLPRSEENHTANGLALDPATDTLFIAQGGHTNMGAPSEKMILLPEYALSAAVLAVDLARLGDGTHDLPTLGSSPNPPFGGRGGANQAVLATDGPVTVHAPGFRNAYDLVWTSSGHLWTVDNGANDTWGAPPVGEGTPDCTNEPNGPGMSTHLDALHLVVEGRYYGHPNPTRGNADSTFDGSSPLRVPEDPRECTTLPPGPENGALATFATSTNGLDEFTVSGFDGIDRGDLVTASFDGVVRRIPLTGDGDDLAAAPGPLFTEPGGVPLDVIAAGEATPFRGTVWATEYTRGGITVFAPAMTLPGAFDPELHGPHAAQVSITPGGAGTASTYGHGSIAIANHGSVDVVGVSLDLTTALLPDLVFDPEGRFGDAVGRDITPADETAAASLAGGDLACEVDGAPRCLRLDLDNLGASEVFAFAVDVDPSSIRGTEAPGPGGSGSVSGLEMTGAQVTATWADGTTATAPVVALPSGRHGGYATVVTGLPATVPDLVVTNAPGGTLADSTARLRVTAPPGAAVRLLVTETALREPAGGGHDIEVGEVNTVVRRDVVTTTVGPDGVVEVPVAATREDADAGILRATAWLLHQGGVAGPTAPPTSVRYAPSGGAG